MCWVRTFLPWPSNGHHSRHVHSRLTCSPAAHSPVPAPLQPEPAEPTEPDGALAAAYRLAFDQWLAQRQAQAELRQASSVAVYRAMWAAFSTWCLGRGLVLATLDAVQIEAFVRSRADGGRLSDRHAWRWLSLLDAVLRQSSAQTTPAAARGARAAGPNRAAAELLLARPAWRFANASALDTLPEHLDATEARRLVDWLLDAAHGYSAPGAALGSWQALRNRAAVALQLGAGLTPGDVRAATVSGVQWRAGQRGGAPRQLRVPAHGAVAERDAPLAAWAGRLLAQWLAARSAAALPGELLFPGTRRGTAWAKVAQYNAAQSVLDGAGISLPGGGSFVLRHSFALRQLRRGHAPERVALWLGVTDPGVMARYQRLMRAPADLA